MLENWWLPPCCEGTCVEPYGAHFPGLSRRSTAAGDPAAAAVDLGRMRAASGRCRLGLVRVDRPADVPAALGWSGMINTTDDIAGISAVLRSWEERFGARLVVLEFDALVLAVAKPPTTKGRALRLAAEHRAFCRYNFTQQPGDLREFAEDLLNRPFWRFWWD